MSVDYHRSSGIKAIRCTTYSVIGKSRSNPSKLNKNINITVTFLQNFSSSVYTGMKANNIR